MSGRAFSHSLRVRFAECDPQGVVFNARYLEYFDVVLTELWRAAFGGYDAIMDEHDVDIVVAEAAIRYRSALRFDEVFELRATIERLGTTSMTTAIAVERDGESVAAGELRHVFIARGSGAKTAIPEPIRAALAPYARG